MDGGVKMSKLEIRSDKKKARAHRAILAHIPTGADNAVSMSDLARVLGEDQRSIRLRIQRARTAGCIIAGTDAGIFIPATEAELREYVARTQARINTSILTLKPARDLLGGLHDE